MLATLPTLVKLELPPVIYASSYVISYHPQMDTFQRVLCIYHCYINMLQEIT